MFTVEESQSPDADLPVAEFRDHLQLGRGFADDGSQDAVLIRHLRAAIRAIEEETGQALLVRDFKLVVIAWRRTDRQTLTRAPVRAVQSFAITDLAGGVETVATSRYVLAADRYTPEVRATGWALPTIPVGGTAEIVFRAGHGDDWDGVPPDLREAAMLLAGHYYEHRSAAGERVSSLPLGVADLLRAWRPVRLGAGR